jgi:hypothetical protein
VRTIKNEIGGRDAELLYPVAGVTMACASVFLITYLFRDVVLKPSHVLNLAWIPFVALAYVVTHKFEPDRELARTNFYCVVAVSATFIAIVTSLPFTICYEPVIPICLPVLWPIWGICIHRFCTDGLLARLSLKFVHASFASLAAFHMWTRSGSDIVMASGAFGFFAVAMLSPLAICLALNKTCGWGASAYSADLESQSLEDGDSPRPEAEALVAPPAAVTSGPPEVIVESPPLLHVDELEPRGTPTLDATLEVMSQSSDAVDTGEPHNLLHRSDSGDSLYRSIHSRVFTVNHSSDSLSQVSTSGDCSSSMSDESGGS